MKGFIASARTSRSTARRAATGTAILGALLAAPSAFAGMPIAAPALATATPSPAIAPSHVFAALSPAETLSNHTLAGIRGGWDISPHVTVDFAYHAITTINGTVVASVMIPHVQFSLGSNGPVMQNAPAITTTSTPPTPLTPAPTVTTPITTARPVTTTPVTTNPVATAPVSHTQAANTPTTGGADPTQSTFNVHQIGSQFASAVTTVSTSGITTLVQNKMNNTVIQNTGWANIGVDGLPTMVTQQAGASMLNRNLVAAGHAFR